MTWRDNLLTTTAGVKLLADDGTTPGGGYKRAVDVVFKVQGGTAGHLAVLTSDGSIADGGAVPSGVSLPVATTSTLGGVKPDGSTVTTDGSGVLTVASIAVTALTDISTVGGPALSDVDVINRAGVDYKGTFSARVALVRKTPAGSRTITLATGSTTATLTAADHDKTVVVTGIAGTLTVDGSITDGFRCHVINHTGSALTYSGIVGLAGTTALANNVSTTVSLANSTTEATGSANSGSGMPTTGGTFTGPIGVSFAALTDAAPVATNGSVNQGNIFRATITAGRTFSAPTNLPPGAYTYIVSSSSAVTPSFPWVTFYGSSDCSIAAGKSIILSVLWDGTAGSGTVQKQV